MPIVYIPTKSLVKDNIVAAVKGQSLVCPFEIVVCNYDKSLTHRECVAKAKDRCKELALKTDEEFIIIHDCDILDLEKDNFEVMHNFLLSNKEYGAVSLSRSYRTLDHVCSGVIMFRRDALQIASFSIFPEQPTCNSIMKSLMDNNFKYDYVDHKTRIRHT